VLHRPLGRIPASEKAALGAAAVVRRYGRALVPFRSRPDPLTDTYLDDPSVRSRLAGGPGAVRS
jgi:hypothetical protein